MTPKNETFAARLNALDVPTPADVVALIYEADEAIDNERIQSFALELDRNQLKSENEDLRRMFAELLQALRKLIQHLETKHDH